jgi:hypothetical protein
MLRTVAPSKARAAHVPRALSTAGATIEPWGRTTIASAGGVVALRSRLSRGLQHKESGRRPAHPRYVRGLPEESSETRRGRTRRRRARAGLGRSWSVATLLCAPRQILDDLVKTAPGEEGKCSLLRRSLGSTRPRSSESNGSHPVEPSTACSSSKRSAETSLACVLR